MIIAAAILLALIAVFFLLLRQGSFYFHYPGGYNVLHTIREIPLRESSMEEMDEAVEALVDGRLQTLGLAPTPDKDHRYAVLRNEGEKGMFVQMFFTAATPPEDEHRWREFRVAKKLRMAEDRLVDETPGAEIRVVVFEIPSEVAPLQKLIREMAIEYQGAVPDGSVYLLTHWIDFPRTKYAVKWQRE